MRCRALEEAERLQHEIDARSARATTTRSIVRELEHVVAVQAGNGLRVELRVGDVPALRADVAAALRDACNEALTNVVKHARVTVATVSVTSTDGGVRVTVHDEGCGFDPSTVG